MSEVLCVAVRPLDKQVVQYVSIFDDGTLASFETLEKTWSELNFKTVLVGETPNLAYTWLIELATRHRRVTGQTIYWWLAIQLLASPAVHRTLLLLLLNAQDGCASTVFDDVAGKVCPRLFSGADLRIISLSTIFLTFDTLCKNGKRRTGFLLNKSLIKNKMLKKMLNW